MDQHPPGHRRRDGGGLTQVSDTMVDGRRVLLYECTWNTLDTHNFPHRLVATATFSPRRRRDARGAAARAA